MSYSNIKGRRIGALSFFHPTWHGACSDVLYILISQAQHTELMLTSMQRYAAHMHVLTQPYTGTDNTAQLLKLWTLKKLSWSDPD